MWIISVRLQDCFEKTGPWTLLLHVWHWLSVTLNGKIYLFNTWNSQVELFYQLASHELHFVGFPGEFLFAVSIRFVCTDGISSVIKQAFNGQSRVMLCTQGITCSADQLIWRPGQRPRQFLCGEKLVWKPYTGNWLDSCKVRPCQIYSFTGFIWSWIEE